jgi:hypothetical protein
MQHSIPVVGEEIVKWTTASFHLSKRELSVAGDVDIKIYKEMVPSSRRFSSPFLHHLIRQSRPTPAGKREASRGR